jgi:hypothetical protein
MRRFVACLLPTIPASTWHPLPAVLPSLTVAAALLLAVLWCFGLISVRMCRLPISVRI